MSSDIAEKVRELSAPRNDQQTMLAALDVKHWVGPRITYPSFMPTPQEPTARLRVQMTIKEMLLAGDTPPADVAAPIIEARRADELTVARTEMILSVLDAAQADVDEATDETIHAALTYLREELQRVVGRAQELAPTLAGVHSSQAVLDAPAAAVDAWRELRDLASQYDEIRRHHRELFNRVWKHEDLYNTPVPKSFASVGHYADFIATTEEWVRLRRQAAGSSWPGEYRDWLAEHTSPTLADLDTLEPPVRLVTIATQSRPWLPNVSEFQTALSAAQGALAPVDDDASLARRVAYRKELLRVTGQQASPVPAHTTNRDKVRKAPSRGERTSRGWIIGSLTGEDQARIQASITQAGRD